MADEIRTLDIAEKQLLIHRGAQEDPECPYHHVILLHRVAEGRWITLTHNDRGEHVRVSEDLDDLQYTVLRRSALFPEYAVDDGLLYFDPHDP